MSIRRIIAGGLAAILAGCAPLSATPNPIPSPVFETSTLPGSVSPTGTPSADTAVPAATPLAVAGTTTTQVNVRQEPLAAGQILGTLAPSASIQIFARDPANNWYQIAYDAGDDGKGWVAAQYVALPDVAAVPTFRAGNGPLASVREQINVRTGPGTQFDAVGLLSARDVVTLTGKDQGGAWIQILYAGGADGRAWVAASYLETAATDGLAILTEAGEVLGTSTPAAKATSPTAMPAIAWEDEDSSAAPGVEARFAPAGSGSVFYSSDLSSPSGDASDWIRFTPYYDSIVVRLDCRGNGKLASEILREGVAMAGVPPVECGTDHVLTLQAGEAYLLHLSIAREESGPTYLGYTLVLLAVKRS